MTHKDDGELRHRIRFLAVIARSIHHSHTGGGLRILEDFVIHAYGAYEGIRRIVE